MAREQSLMFPLDLDGQSKKVGLEIEVVCSGVAARSGDLVFHDQDDRVVVQQSVSDQVVLPGP
jgi:regulator of RNase E activity RraA